MVWRFIGDISKVLKVNNQDITRKNVFKLDKFRFKREIGRNWFSDRVVKSESESGCKSGNGSK